MSRLITPTSQELRDERRAGGSRWLAPREADELRAENARLGEKLRIADAIIEGLVSERMYRGVEAAEA